MSVPTHPHSEPRRSAECGACGFDPGAYLRLLAERDQLRREIAELRAALASRESPSAVRTLSPSAFDRAQKTPTLAPPPPMAETWAEAPRATFDPWPGPGAGTARREQGLDFGAVSRLSPEELDGLPYGLITLDALGRVVHYNDTESRMVGLPKERVLGRSFFGDVAPCARVREFQGRFEELVRDPHRVRVQAFDFVFKFASGEHQVSIVITPARTRGLFHVALVRR
jgi:photoactive yellow protein